MDAPRVELASASFLMLGNSLPSCSLYKGSPNCNFKIGFSGLLLVLPIDTEKNWRIVPYGRRDLIQAEYIEIHRNKIGQTCFVPTGEYDTPIRKDSIH